MLNRHATLALAAISTEAMQLRQGLAQIEAEIFYRHDYNECMMSGGSTTECYDLSWAQVGAETTYRPDFNECMMSGGNATECYDLSWGVWAQVGAESTGNQADD